MHFPLLGPLFLIIPGVQSVSQPCDTSPNVWCMQPRRHRCRRAHVQSLRFRNHAALAAAAAAWWLIASPEE